MVDVGKARVEVQGDVRNFARQTERDLNSALSRIDLTDVRVDADQAHARASGEVAGRQLGDGVASGTRQSTGKVSSALKSAFTPDAGLFASLRAPFTAALSTPVLGAAIAVAAVAAAAFVAAFAAALATAGLGAAFLGIGIAAVQGNKALGESFKGLVTTIKSVGRAAAAPLIGPLIAALSILEKAVIRVGPLLTKIFTALAPAIGPIAEGIAGFVEEFLKVLTQDPSTLEAIRDALIAFGANLPRVGAALGGFFEILASNENNVRNIGLLFGFVESTIQGLGETLYGLSVALDAIITAWNAVGAAISTAIGWITGTAVPAIVAAAVAVGAFFQRIPAMIASAWTAIVGFFTGILGSIVGFLSATGAAVISFFTAIPGRVMGVLGSIIGFLTSIGQAVISFFAALPGRIVGAIAALPGVLGAFFSGLLNRVAFAIGFGIGTVVGFFAQLPGRVIGAVQALAGMLSAFFSSVWNTARSIVSSGVSAVVSFFAALPGRARGAISSLVGAVSGVFRSVWSTARSLASSGVSAVVGFFAQLPGRARSAISAIVGAVRSVFSSARSTAISLSSSLVSGAINAIRALPGRIRSALSSVKSAVLGAFSGAGSWLVGAGRSIISGLASGVRSAMGSAIAAARNAAAQVVAGFKSALRIGSPSKLMNLEVGRMIPAGVAEGVTDNAGIVDKAIKDMVGQAALPALPPGRTRGGDGASLGASIQVVIQAGAIVVQGQGRDAGEAAAEAILERLSAATLAR